MLSGRKMHTGEAGLTQKIEAQCPDMSNSDFKGLKILIVDDEADLRMINVDRFTMLGCEVHEAANGTEAFEIYQRVRPRVVLTDMQMRGGDGLQLLNAIRNHPEASNAIIVIASGYSDSSSKDLKSAGADAIVAKPYSMKQISEVVQKLLSSSS